MPLNSKLYFPDFIILDSNEIIYKEKHKNNSYKTKLIYKNKTNKIPDDFQIYAIPQQLIGSLHWYINKTNKIITFPLSIKYPANNKLLAGNPALKS